MASIDLLLFVVLPYAATLLCAIATIERYRRHPFSFTSHSSQFVEGKLHFWALMPFHAGILLVLAGHLVAFLIPRAILAWNALPVRVLILEITGLTGGLLALAGLVLIVARRLRVRVVRETTTRFDWAVYAVLLAEITTGVVLAILYPWGSSWYAVTAAPYLWSLVTLRPDAASIAAMPLLIQLHVALAWLLVAAFSFSRLVHVLTVPNQYFWRAPQVVRWVHRPAAPAARES